MKVAIAALLLALLSIPSQAAYPIHWDAPKHCLNSKLVNALHDVSQLSPVVVRSTCRSAKHNRRVGGAKRSYHLTGNAVDFRVRPSADIKDVLFNNTAVGGYKHYGNGLWHIDVGPRRTWQSKNKTYRKKNLSNKGRVKTLNSSFNSSPQKGYWDNATGN